MTAMVSNNFSGYVLRKDRTEAPAGGGEDIGTAPPTPAEFEWERLCRIMSMTNIKQAS